MPRLLEGKLTEGKSLAQVESRDIRAGKGRWERRARACKGEMGDLGAKLSQPLRNKS